jgi:cytochrome b561
MIRNGRDAFGWGTIVLHWMIAGLMIGLIILGFIMVRTDIDPELQFSLYQWHKSFGMTALALSIVRVIWWLANRNPDPVADLSRIEARSASVVHIALLGLTLAIPLAGWAVASTSTLGIPTLLFDSILVPHLPMQKSAEAEAFWTATHALLAYGLGGLVFLHAAAALHHEFLRRDKVLSRMIRGGSGKK